MCSDILDLGGRETSFLGGGCEDIQGVFVDLGSRRK